MIEVDISELEGIWVAPKHPVTCTNPSPWQIQYVKVSERGLVRVRCDGSMWFRLEDCVIDTKENLEEWLMSKGWK